MTLRHRIRGKLQKLPVAMPAVIGCSWQIAEFAKARVTGAFFDMLGPELTVESVPTPQRSFPEAVARGFHAAD